MTKEAAETQRVFASQHLEEAVDQLDAAIWTILGEASQDPCYGPLSRAQENVNLDKMATRLKTELRNLERVCAKLSKEEAREDD